MTLSQRWDYVESRFFHPELRANRILIRQARLMFAVCLLGGALFFILILGAFLDHPQSQLKHNILLAGHAILCSSMITLRLFPTMKVPARVMAVTLCLQLAISTLLTGGVQSPSLYQFALAACFIGMVGTVRETIGTATFLCGTAAALWFSHQLGFDLTHDEPLPTVKSASLAISCVIGGAMAIFMALQARVLLDMLDSELEARKVAQRRAESANQTKNLYMAFLSHEIRNPLQAILTHVELVRDPDLDERDRAACLEGIAAASKGLSGMLHDVLTFSALEREEMLVRQDEVQLLPLLEDVVSMHREAARQRGLSLTLRGDSSVLVLGDVHRIRQVLSNLITNAIKYTPAGEVTVATRRDGDRLFVHVIDSGPGIAPDLASDIFRPFERVSTETAPGTGIGLAVCHGLVTRMGGRLRLQTEPGRGSDFFFDLAVPTSAD